MLDTPLKESEARSWIYVALLVVVIYSTIPVARALREAVDAQIGREIFLYLTLVLTLLGAGLAYLSLRRRQLPRSAYIWLLFVFILFLVFIYRLREIPEEAIHVAEYGILGVLVFRALSHRVRDSSIYIMSCVVVGMTGIVDEYIQWVAPTRYYDLRDVGTNFLAGALSQITIAAGLRPGLIAASLPLSSWSRCCYLIASMLMLLSLSFVNTPPRIAWYTSKIPELQFLMDSKSMMAEYGYLHKSDSNFAFKSRFSVEQLLQLDRERGPELARILDRYIRGEGYRSFHRIYTVSRDAYVHEAGVHLFRREFHLDQARKNNDQQGEHYWIAHYENLILKKYFTNAMEHSRHNWEEELTLEVSANTSKQPAYESTVSKNVITSLREWQVHLLFLIFILFLVLLGLHLRRLTREDDIVEKP